MRSDKKHLDAEFVSPARASRFCLALRHTSIFVKAANCFCGGAASSAHLAVDKVLIACPQAEGESSKG